MGYSKQPALSRAASLNDMRIIITMLQNRPNKIRIPHHLCILPISIKMYLSK